MTAFKFCWLNLLILFIKVEKSNEVPFESWHCGSDEKTRSISYDTMLEECPDVLVEFNDCCFNHDECYSKQLGQAKCDDIFCGCLDEAAIQASSYDNCKTNAWWACFSVRMFGESAYITSSNHNNDGLIGQRTLSNSTSSVVKEQKNLCIIDDAEVHQHYKLAVENCNHLKEEFSKCCLKHTECHRNINNSPETCHHEFGSCLIEHREDAISGTECRNAVDLIYNELIGDKRYGEKKGFIYTLRYWLNRFQLDVTKSDVLPDQSNIYYYLICILVTVLLSVSLIIIIYFISQRTKRRSKVAIPEKTILIKL